MNERLESAFARFERLAKSYGLGGIEAPDPDIAREQIRKVADAVFPRQLPPELVWLWERFGPASPANVCLFPEFCGPEFAAATYDEFNEWPKALVPICYTSHVHLLMELAYEGSVGPWIYYFEWAGEGIQLVATGLAELFEGAAADIESGLEEDTVGLRELLQSRLSAEIPAEERRDFDYNHVLDWPQRWQLEQGVTFESAIWRGVTHTIAELQAARRLGPVTATISGRVRNVAGSAAGALVMVDDGTERVQVLVPSSVPSLRRSETDEYELDVVAGPLTAPEPTLDDFGADHAEVQRLALSGDIEGAARASAEMGKFIHGEHPIVATAQRPL